LWKHSLMLQPTTSHDHAAIARLRDFDFYLTKDQLMPRLR
jgi:hypothetical protein